MSSITANKVEVKLTFRMTKNLYYILKIFHSIAETFSSFIYRVFRFPYLNVFSLLYCRIYKDKIKFHCG